MTCEMRDGWMGCMDGQMNAWMHGWMDRWVDEWDQYNINSMDCYKILDSYQIKSID